MSHTQFRRNPSKQSKLKKQTRASEPLLLGTNPSNMKNYLSYFNLKQSGSDKENQGESQMYHGQQSTSLSMSKGLCNSYTPSNSNGGMRKKESEVCFTRKSQNTFSLEKDKRIPFGDRYGLKTLENGGYNDNKQTNYLGKSSSMSLSMMVKTDKKGSSQLKSRMAQDIQNCQNMATTDLSSLGQKKFIPYFIESFTKNNKIMTQALLNIHISIITFKTFKRACMFTKPRNPDPKVPPENPGRKTIIFDMDETLIHTNQLITPGYQIKVPFRSLNGRILYGYVCVRPYAKQLLKRLSEHFDIIVFTAGSQPYADPILDHIDPQNVIQHRLYRESCTLVDNQVFVKDLRIVGRSLENVVLVDNAPHTYMMQMANGIPILPYYKGKQDKQLYSLETYLMGLKDVEDMRRVNTETFQLEQYMRFDSREKAVASLYGKHL